MLRSVHHFIYGCTSLEETAWIARDLSWQQAAKAYQEAFGSGMGSSHVLPWDWRGSRPSRLGVALLLLVCWAGIFSLTSLVLLLRAL